MLSQLLTLARSLLNKAAILTALVISGPVQAQDDWAQAFAQSNDGTHIAYYSKGTRREGQSPLFIISGGPGSDHRYMRIGGSLDALAKTRQVISFDQRGTSHSGMVTGTPTLAQWADDVEAVRVAAGAPQLDLLGHSFGGIVAMAYADAYAERVNSISFVNSTAPTIADTKSILADVFPDRIQAWQNTRRSLSPRFRARDIRVFTEMEFVNADMSAVFVRAIDNYIYNIEVNNELRRDMASLDYSDTLKTASFPVLIVHGRYDPVIAPSVSWKLHQLIPHSRLTIIEAAGHLPFVEKPVEFVHVVDEFLKSEAENH